MKDFVMPARWRSRRVASGVDTCWSHGGGSKNLPTWWPLVAEMWRWWQEAGATSGGYVPIACERERSRKCRETSHFRTSHITPAVVHAARNSNPEPRMLRVVGDTILHCRSTALQLLAVSGIILSREFLGSIVYMRLRAEPLRLHSRQSCFVATKPQSSIDLRYPVPCSTIEAQRKNVDRREVTF